MEKKSSVEKIIVEGSVAKSYAERRRPSENQVRPHPRYNPDTLNKEEKELD